MKIVQYVCWTLGVLLYINGRGFGSNLRMKWLRVRTWVSEVIIQRVGHAAAYSLTAAALLS